MADIYLFRDEDEDEGVRSVGGSDEEDDDEDEVIHHHNPIMQILSEDTDSFSHTESAGSDSDDSETDNTENSSSPTCQHQKSCESPPVPQNIDDLLPPLAKLQKYSESENIFHRQMVAHSLLETLRAVADSDEDVDAVLGVVSHLSEDNEASVRSELLEQMAHVSLGCESSNDFASLGGGRVSHRMFPVIVRALTDSNSQVRKTAQAALLLLMEQGIASAADVEKDVCPVLKTLAESAADEYRVEAVALMGKLAPLVGGHLTEKLFLDTFAARCSDSVFHVRKVCASNFGDMCVVLGMQTSEKLVSHFISLCEDAMWGVRKGCAEVFTTVACSCSLRIRKRLAKSFIYLLCDESRWVRMAAFHALGSFIATFAADDESCSEDDASDLPPPVLSDESDDERLPPPRLRLAEADPVIFTSALPDPPVSNKELQPPARDAVAVVPDVDTDTFNEFQYWRLPIPQDIELDLKAAPSSVSVPEVHVEKPDLDGDVFLGPGSTWAGKGCDWKRPNAGNPSGCVPIDWKDGALSGIIKEDQEFYWTNYQLFSHLGDHKSFPSLDDNSSAPLPPSLLSPPPAAPAGLVQHIVPQQLVDYYVSMVQPSHAQLVDNDIAHHCAYSLPAVAQTLGRVNWPLLRSLYETLASDMQWKVRRTLAASIHEIAVIIGEEASGNDLVPVFNGFIKDLDEVRIGALRHFYDFLRLLNPSKRLAYLPQFSQFLRTDNERNWRFRLELVKQLILIVPLFSPEDIGRHFVDVALTLLADRVSEIRLATLDLITGLAEHLLKAKDGACNNHVRSLLSSLADQLAHSSRWAQRQLFAILCSRFLMANVLPTSQFASDILPHLLGLAVDRVPNVRIAVARVLSNNIVALEFFSDMENPHCDVLAQVLNDLKNDSDRDVRYFASAKPHTASATVTSVEMENVPTV